MAALLLVSDSVAGNVPPFSQAETLFSSALAVISKNVEVNFSDLDYKPSRSLVSFCRSRLNIIGASCEEHSGQGVLIEMCEALYFYEYDIALDNILYLVYERAFYASEGKIEREMLQRALQFVDSGAVPINSERRQNTMHLIESIIHR
jgi:hypothetical protein